MGGVNIPLEANNLQPQAIVDPLQEQMRAASLAQSAAQTQGIQQQNQAQALQLKDEMLRRQLAPQYVQKDENGKITGFDNEGLYGDMLSHGADPATIQAMRMKNTELQKALIGLNNEQLDHSQKVGEIAAHGLEGIQQIQDQAKKANGVPPTPQPAVPAAPASPAISPGTQNPAAAPLPIGNAPAGTPTSLLPAPQGSVPTPTESAATSAAASAPRPIMPEAQRAYHQLLVGLQAKGINIAQFPPVLNDESELEQAEASIGQFFQIHKDQLADQKTLAEAHQAQGKGDLDTAEAGLKQIELNLSKNATPGTFDQQIDGLKLPLDQSAMLKEQINQTLARGDVPTAKKIVSSALENVQAVNKDVAESTNPQIRAGKKQQAEADAEARQNAAQGDPNVAGQMLAHGQLTLADLKSRGTTPQYITQSVTAAQKVNPAYNPADEVIAESVAKSPSANQFFGSANSLIAKGGTLDQLANLGKNIPQHNWPVLNSVDDWQQLARGKGPLAGYAAVALGAADDYGKVMGGGNASDHARDAALSLFAKAASPEQREDAINATRGAVQSQRDSRIGNNQFLKRQYGVEVSPSTSQKTTPTPPAGATPAGAVTRIKDSNGNLHDIPTANLNAAKKIDPGLTVQQ